MSVQKHTAHNQCTIITKQSKLFFQISSCIQVVEFDETSVLMKNPDSIFSKMLAAAKIVEQEHLQEGKFNPRTEQSSSFLRNSQISPEADDSNVSHSNFHGSHENPAFQSDDA